ncbi:MAG: DUF6029 family protein [Ignavibacteria bacterium]|jgi:hypothetical protein|nr:DUF6029 family protein [Ignavibacteria bacterium]
MKRILLYFLVVILIASLVTSVANAQSDLGGFSGSFQLEGQTYKSDSLMEAKKVSEQIQSNGYFNLNYNNGGLTAGIRYEYYLNPLQGIDTRYKGQGIAYRYANYSNDFIEVTAGNFYEQFGSGMIFRAYEEKALGWDNAMDGARFKVYPTDGIEVVGIWGTQRNYWTQGAGVIRGGDLNFSLNELLGHGIFGAANLTAGASVVSVYQQDRDLLLKMPENVLAWSGRAALLGDKYSVDAEYSYKYNAPDASNKNSFNPGYGFILNGSYFTSGFSANLGLHKIDNMDFRSDRNASKADLMLGYIPPLTKLHSYRLATMYPYATQFNGEAGLQAEVDYKFARNTFLGGAYGTDVAVNYSLVYNLDSSKTGDYTYDSPFFGIGDDLYFQDFNINLQHKFSSDFKGAFTYFNQKYNIDVIENSGAPGAGGYVYTNILVAEGTYRFTNKYSLKVELEHQWASLDTLTSHNIINGNWFGFLAEFTISPGWYITFYDDWNYGNDESDRQIHYYNGSLAFTTGSTRLSLGYGRQRAGILCVGGVCRQVPASNGFYLSVNTAF